MARTVSYNNIDILLTQVREVSHTPEFTSDGSYLRTRIALSITGYVNTGATSYVTTSSGAALAQSGSSPTPTLLAIRHQLLQPRGTLIFDIGDVGDNGTPMIVSPAGDAPCDVNNGPKPIDARLMDITGTTTALLHFSIETWVIECPGGTEPTTLISNRYSQIHSIGPDHYTTIRTTGESLFRTDLLEIAGIFPDAYREVLFPPTPNGLQRMGAEITLVPSRNALAWTVIDVEKAYDLGETDARVNNGSGIVDLKATRDISGTGTREGGQVSYMLLARVQLQARGNKFSSTWRMTQELFSFAGSLLPLGDPTAGYPKQVSVSQGITERVVGLVVEMMLTPKVAGQLTIINGDLLRNDNPFPDRGGVNPAFPNRNNSAGTYADEMMVAAWKSACMVVEKSKGGSKPGVLGTSDSADSFTTPVIEISTSDTLPDYPTLYSASTSQFPYTDYGITIENKTRTFRMQVPATGPASPQDDGTSSDSSGSSNSGSDYGGDPPAGYGGSTNAIDTPSGGTNTTYPSCEILTLAQPMSRRLIRWTAERVNAVPDVPNPNPSAPNCVLVGDPVVETESPVLLPDGTSLCFRASGCYEWAWKTAKGPTDDLAMGLMPWISGSAGVSIFPASGFVDGMIDGSDTGTIPDDSGPVGNDN